MTMPSEAASVLQPPIPGSAILAGGDGSSAPDFLRGGSEMAARIRAFDWSKTAIGPAENWPLALKMSISFLLANRFPQILWWGPRFIQFYNDAYVPIPGDKHPEISFGQPGSACWSEIWHIIGPLIERPFNGGAPTWDDDILLEVNRRGFMEETHFTIAYSPVPDETVPSRIGGVLGTVHEITAKVIGERRVVALRDLAARATAAKTAEEACAIAAGTLAKHAKDVPFAMLYLTDPDGRTARLAGSTGVAGAGLFAPLSIDLGSDAVDVQIWPLAQVARTKTMAVVDGLAERFGDAVPPGPWAGPPRGAVVLPIHSSMTQPLAGFLVAGVSARLQLDELYRGFYELVASQIASAVANARAYEEERKRAEALAEIDRAKTLFFSNVSHEFRTPLTLMLGPLQDALASVDLPDSERQRLDLAHRNSLRLLKLVNSLLDFSRIEAGRAQASYEPVDLGALTTELASNFRSACERAGLMLIVDCPPLPDPVHVDRDMWEKIVLNLLSNAFKFTFEGEISVRLRAVDGGAELSVCDTGVGIPRHELPRLFERFHRIEGQKSRTYEGSGIGLALVHELVKLHGGVIHADSMAGRGTSFTVTVPSGTAHLPQDRIGAERNAASTSVRADAYVQEALRWLPDAAQLVAGLQDVTVSAAIPQLRGARILLADDNADMRAYIRKLLESHCEVQTVADGLAALEAIRARRPDLVLADVMMPRLDGLQLLQAIRNDPAVRDIPVIMLSARAGEESRIQGLEAGADDYLVKPFSARDLLARVDNNLKLAKLRREAVAAIEESERRYRSLVTASSDAVYRMSPDWREMRHLVGRGFIANTVDPSRTWLETYIHPADRPHVMAAVDEAIRTKNMFELEHRIVRVDGSLGWTFSRAIPVLDDGGDIVEWIGTASDVTERKRQEERQRLLVDELNHRVKNTLATVQSLAMQTLRNAGSLAEGRMAFDARLIALSKTHDVLTRRHWDGAELHEIVSEAMAAYAGHARERRFQFDGPSIRLLPKTALALSMALHELATNAAKYGALSNGTGRVGISWLCDEARHFQLRWVESGGPAVAAPRRRGFGSRLIEQGLAQDLGGRVRLDFAPQGLVCTVDAPLDEIGAGSG